MAISTLSPRFSFIELSLIAPNVCAPIPRPVLPIISPNDISFQLICTSPIESEIDALMAMDIADVVLKIDGINMSSARNVFDRFRISANTVLLIWDKPLTNFDSLASNKCLGVSVSAPPLISAEGALLMKLPPSQRCFTSVFTYRNNENAFGFNYCVSDFANRVRLPIYFRNPQLIEEKTTYATSSGAIKVLKAQSKKEFEGVTEYFPASFHEKIAMMLAHDYVHVVSDLHIGEISRTGAYEIDWPDFAKQTTAQATFKAIATPYNWTNDSCNSCGVDECLTEVISLNVTVQEVEWGAMYILNYELSDLVSFDLFYSLDNGATWLPLTYTSTSFGQLVYDLGDYPEQPHLLKMVPVCGPGNEGSPGVIAVGDHVCTPPSMLSMQEMNATTWIATFKAAQPAPPFNYAWELKEVATGVTVQANNNFYQSGGTLTVVLGALKSNTAYVFNVKSRCAPESFSAEVSQSFHTAVGTGSGAVTLNCEGQGVDSTFHIGVPSSATFNIAIDAVLQEGKVLAEVYSSASGTISGYAIYGNVEVNVTNATTYLSIPVNYDGGGVAGLVTITFKVTGKNGIQICEGLYSIES